MPYGGFGNRRGGGGFKRRSFGPREMHEITCAECGKKDTVPFKPREGTPVLCKQCYLKKKGITPREPVEETKETEETKEEETAEEKVEESEKSEEESEEKKEE